MFDAVWTIIHESHFDTNFNGVNWQALRDELRPRAAQAADAPHLRETLEQMLRRLGQSHMGIIPTRSAPAIERSVPVNDGATSSGSVITSIAPNHSEESSGEHDGAIGIEVRLIDGHIVVTDVERGGAADEAQMKPGWIIRRIDNELVPPPVRKSARRPGPASVDFLSWRKTMDLLRGPPGSIVQLECVNGKGRSTALEVRRRLQRGELTKLGSLPPFRAYLESDWISTNTRSRIGLIRFNVWMIPIAKPFQEAIDRFRAADGIIVDLRGNVGGVGALLVGIAGHFFAEPVSLGTMQMRDMSLQFFVNPRRVDGSGNLVEPYSGPVAILVDSISLSLAEVFAGGMQSVGRARIFGETSGGQTLPAIWHRLPNGDLLYHAFADFTTPGGVRLEGRGVIPDVTASSTRKDLLAGRDKAKELAIRWIEQERVHQRAANPGMPVTNAIGGSPPAAKTSNLLNH
jgi:carboxyl-terminal processing protease